MRQQTAARKSKPRDPRRPADLILTSNGTSSALRLVRTHCGDLFLVTPESKVVAALVILDPSLSVA
jgi:hypothetical protein